MERLEWLGGMADPAQPLEGIAHTKLRQFAAERAAMAVSDLLAVAQPGRRHTLLLALLRQARTRCRDELVEKCCCAASGARRRSSWHRDNDLPLLWPIHARHRALRFRLIDPLDIRSATQDRSLLHAWAVVSAHRHACRPEAVVDRRVMS